MNFRSFFLIILGVYCIFFLTACAGNNSSGYSLTGGPAPLVKPTLSVQVAPGFRPLALNSAVVLPLEGEDLWRVPSLANVADQELLRNFDLWTGMEVKSAKSVAGWEKIATDAGPQVTRAMQLAKLANAQGALFGVVTNLKGPGVAEHDGQSSAPKPLHVGFRLWLIGADSSDILWSADFEHREQALSENLFRASQVKAGLTQERAEQVLFRGFAEAARALEELRSQY